MTEGKVNYADLASMALRFTQGSAVITVVIDGNQGSGFAIQAREGFTFDVAKVMRDIADKLDASKKQSN
jgi:hypothetical protein